MQLDRRLNLLLYLNKEWKEEYGGHFELWNRDVTTCEAKILPIFNRCVIFNTSDFSYHGHPNPLNCPENLTRKSLALYYYSNGRPQEEISGKHSTIFQERPGENLRERKKISPKQVLKKLLPPIIVDVAKSIKNQEK